MKVKKVRITTHQQGLSSERGPKLEKDCFYFILSLYKSAFFLIDFHAHDFHNYERFLIWAQPPLKFRENMLVVAYPSHQKQPFIIAEKFVQIIGNRKLILY